MSAKSDRDVDRIVSRDRPGYRRVAGPRRTAASRSRVSDSGTPDLPELHAAVESLRLWDSRAQSARRRARAGAEKAVRSKASPDTHRGAPATHHIVTVSHARPHESDPLQTRVVVVSRSRGRIIGEQG